ncbi:MAG: hypothetical protein MI747_08220 [Desulfobacterales bacterium]|nr:hypothetical protein [Desulfobacterales bacterium]
MNRLTLTGDGKIRFRGEPVTQSVYSLLSRSIDLAGDVTLASFFRMIRNYPDFLVLSEMLPALMEICSTSQPGWEKTEEIDSLVFYKTITMKGGKERTGLEIYTSLAGVKDAGKVQLKFFQLESLLGHSLELGQLEHVIFGDGQDLFQYDTVYTLFEFIEGICWELSFNFNPLQCTLRR